MTYHFVLCCYKNVFEYNKNGNNLKKMSKYITMIYIKLKKCTSCRHHSKKRPIIQKLATIIGTVYNLRPMKHLPT